MKVKSVHSNGRGTGGVTGKGFKPGQSGNPGGRAAVPSEVREALASTTMERLQTLGRLAGEAEDQGDLKTAAYIHLALLKKTVPDASELVISMPEGLSVRSITIDPRKLTEAQLAAVHAAVTAAKGAE